MIPAREVEASNGYRYVQYRYPAYTGEEPCVGYEDLYLSDDDLTVEQIDEMRDRCLDCPLLTECQQWATAHEEFGFWGGLTPQQRARSRRQQRLALAEPSRNVRVNGDHFRKLPDKCTRGHWVSTAEILGLDARGNWKFMCKECFQGTVDNAKRNGAKNRGAGVSADGRHPWKGTPSQSVTQVRDVAA